MSPKENRLKGFAFDELFEPLPVASNYTEHKQNGIAHNAKSGSIWQDCYGGFCRSGFVRIPSSQKRHSRPLQPRHRLPVPLENLMIHC
jgi:hypothetical protein